MYVTAQAMQRRVYWACSILEWLQLNSVKVYKHGKIIENALLQHKVRQIISETMKI